MKVQYHQIKTYLGFIVLILILICLVFFAGNRESYELSHIHARLFPAQKPYAYKYAIQLYILPMICSISWNFSSNSSLISCTFFFSFLISFLLLAPKPGPKRNIRKKKLRKNRIMIYVLKTKSSNCFASSLMSTWVML